MKVYKSMQELKQAETRREIFDSLTVKQPSVKKKSTCLRCDKPHEATPENRLCWECHTRIKEQRL